MGLRSIGLPAPGDVYPFTLSWLDTTRTLDLSAGVNVLVGENGSGKSTLLEALAIAGELPTAGAVDLARDDTLDAVRPLADALRLSWSVRRRRGLFLRAEDYFGYVQRHRRSQAELRDAADEVARTSAHVFDLERQRRMAPYLGPVRAAEARYGGDLDARSHGESFLAFFRARLTGPGLFVLDEPEAALSPLRQLSLLALMAEAVARGAQFVIATHAPILMAAPGARLFELRVDGIHDVGFDDVDHVRTLRAFLADPQAFLRHL